MMPLLQVVYDALRHDNAPSKAEEKPIGFFFLYGINGSYIGEDRIYSSFFDKLESDLTPIEAVLFIPRGGEVLSEDEISPETAWSSCDYFVVGGRACRVDRSENRQGLAYEDDDGFWSVSPEEANVMLGIAAF